METTADPRARVKRRLTLAGVVAAHVLLVALLLGSRGGDTPYREGTSLKVLTISDTAGAPAAAASKPLPAAAPEPRPSPVLLPAPPPQIGGSIAGATAGAGAVDGGCAVAATIGHAIEADPQAIAALLALPPEARSSADAVNLWNGGWLQVPTVDGTDTLAPVRAIVEQAFAASDTACIDATNPGPQFIYVKVGDRTLTVVAGSGSWRWSDMLQSDSYDAKTAVDALNTAAVIK